jgi:NADH-quinone oxidoreductase subunit L
VILHWVWLMPAIMGVSFFAILFFGKRLPQKGSEIGIAAVGICFLIAILSTISWIGHVNDAEGSHASTGSEATATSGGDAAVGHASDQAAVGGDSEQSERSEPTGDTEHTAVQPVVTERTWFEAGGQDVKVGTMVDGLSVMMFLVVTIISLLVHIYSTDYVGGDRRYTHYFAFLSLFTASMLMLVMSSNIIQFITSWELVGLCSFALIGHWWEEKPNSDAALKAFITNRVGDVGLLVGMIILFWAAGSFDILEINTLANNGGIGHLLLLVAACCLTAAVMSKSGQFILHTWLPDAMAGPTPVSALIHAATMVVAGIFMVARLYSVFFHGLSIGDGNANLLAVVGGVTVLGGAGLAFVQNDIKKVLAYSTVSQLGYMVMALGVGAWTAALFHLFTHAFFKAGLFLGAGSVAHSVHSFDMKEDMGGLKRFMPKTFWTFIICTVALIGVPPLAGFWSKDEILTGGHQLGTHNAYETFMVVGIIGALMTAAYMTRCVYLTFFGEPRGAAADPHHPPHESGPRIVVPLYILSFLAFFAGLANFPWGPDNFALRFEHFVQPVGDYFPTISELQFNPGIALVSTLAGFLGILLAYAYWFRGAFHGATERSRVAHAGHTLLVNKYYFDHLYTGVIADGTKGPIARISYWIDQNVIDGVVNAAGIGSRVVADFLYGTVDQGLVDGAVNGSGYGAEGTGQLLRRIQSGKVQQYGALLFGGAVILAGVLVFTL